MSRLPVFRKSGTKVPVFSTVMDNDNHELQRVLEETAAFCAQEHASERETMLIRLAVEELCMVTIGKAFSGKPDEYIQLTLAHETNGDYTLYIRNSAPLFNPLDLRMEKLSREKQEELLDSIGVMMVREKVKNLRFRHYQGFNLMTVVI